jgi:hypothetical protein
LPPRDSPNSSLKTSFPFPRPLTIRNTPTRQVFLASAKSPASLTTNAAIIGESSTFTSEIPHQASLPESASEHKRSQNTYSLRDQGATERGRSKPRTQDAQTKRASDRTALAVVRENQECSSIASLSTLTIPMPFCPHSSGSGSSVYSCDSKGFQVPPEPEVVRKSFASSQLLPETSPRQAISLDDMIFKTLGWGSPTESDSQCPDLKSSKAATGSHAWTETSPPTLTSCNDHSTVPTAQAEKPSGTGSAGSETSRSAPQVSVARSSDDVFGREVYGLGLVNNSRETLHFTRNERILHLANESKLSQEDLARYGGKTAPGNVEWV